MKSNKITQTKIISKGLRKIIITKLWKITNASKLIHFNKYLHIVLCTKNICKFTLQTHGNWLYFSGFWTILQDAKMTCRFLPCLRNPGYFFHPRWTFWWANEDTGQMSPLPSPIWHPVWHLLHVCRSSSKSIHVSFRTRSGVNSELLMCQTTLKQSRNCEEPFRSLEDFFKPICIKYKVIFLHFCWGLAHEKFDRHQYTGWRFRNFGAVSYIFPFVTDWWWSSVCCCHSSF